MGQYDNTSAGYEIDSEVVSRSRFISKHSGRELERVKINMVIKDEAKMNE